MLGVQEYSLVWSPALREKLERERTEAHAFYSMAQVQRRQQRFEFRIVVSPELRKSVSNVFHGKCAYCETPLTATGSGRVCCYRPKGSVMEDSDHPGYWWLAYEGTNLLFACAACDNAKRNRFPLLDTSKRAKLPSVPLDTEFPLLLNPYLVDPQEHLIFAESGFVSSTTAQGQTTIAVLDLNRLALVAARKNQAEQMKGIIQSMNVIARGRKYGLDLDADLSMHRARLDDMVRAPAAYAGANRQLFRRAVEQLNLPKPNFEWFEKVPTPSIIEEQKAQLEQLEFVAEQTRYSLNKAEDLERYRLQSRVIESISIVNIRAIEHLHIDMGAGPDDAGAWMVLLGENGTGKTTVLRAIATVLAGTDICTVLIKQGLLVPAEFIRHRCKSGHIKVKISGFPQAHEVVFTTDRFRFTSGTGEVTELAFKDGKIKRTGSSIETPTVLLGYGATRLAPQPHAKTGEAFGKAARIENLFNPFLPLADSNAWLSSLSIKQFSLVSFILRDLLCLPPTAKFSRSQGRVSVNLYGVPVPLRLLSDGYKGIIALTTDILQTASRIWPNLSDAEGIVLLDEIGTHLHPRWQMRVVTGLRTALPGVQFIVTTHDPLCLRGVSKGEVVILQRDVNGNLETLSDLPSPGDFRVDQLLTSSFFGLNSTSDPVTEGLFNEYYALLAKPQKTKAEQARLTALKAELKDRQHFGDTPREERMYKMIDESLALRRQGGDRVLPKIEKGDQLAISNLWQRALAKAKRTT